MHVYRKLEILGRKALERSKKSLKSPKFFYLTALSPLCLAVKQDTEKKGCFRTKNMRCTW